MTPAYFSRSMESLTQSEDRICAKKYQFREDIDKDFFGGSGLRQNRNLDVEEWICKNVRSRLMEIESKPLGGIRRRFARFPRQEFRRDLINQVGEAVGGLTAFMILYYIVVAIYWWRRWRSAYCWRI